MASHLRLRLVVRRNGLPETNVIWPVSLDDKPTVARLLEQVNEILPLESADWGLEDYAVELKGSDGCFFECLHFQPVYNVFKEDDQVFIRPLFTDDLRQRRVSGRHQISNDGKHLIDGLAFGRPLLKTPRGRPALDIPPRKRRRVSLDMSMDDEDDEDADYDHAEEDLEPMLLLTNGEQLERRSVRIATDFENMGADSAGNEQEEHEKLQDGMSSEQSSDSDGDEEDDLAKELEDLQDEDGQNGAKDYEHGKDQVDQDDQEELVDATRTRNGKVESGARPRDEIGTLLTAFPTAPVQVCREVLAAEVGDLQKSYLTLSQAFEPKVPESELLKRWRGDDRNVAETAQGSAVDLAPNEQAENGQDDDDDDDGDDEDDNEDEDENDHITPFIRRFDHQGLPPGSISSGNALDAMAAMSSSFTNDKSGSNSMSTSHTLTSRRITFDDLGNAKAGAEESETSSSGTSSSSEDGEASDDTSEEENGHDSEDSDTSSSQDSDSDSDSAPEEQSAKEGAPVQGQKAVTSMRGSSSEDSDADETSSDSSEDSSDDDSLDSKDMDVADKFKSNPVSTPTTSTTLEAQAQPSKCPEYTGIPGSGSISTKKRNARRRLAAKNQKTAQPQATPTASNVPAHALEKSKAERERELFEAKRKALLEAIANGGIEVGPGGDSALDGQASQKRKRDEPIPAKPGQSPAAASAEVSNVGSPSSAQKRRRLDLGAGRRMLFGALGLRNPKSKDDEEKLRTKLMKNVNPLQNARLAAEKQKDAGADIDEAADAWRGKITYRAVECCQEGVELSEPPFPFVQRWDPQQQNAWFQNKRGGKGKKAARNQSHYYQDDRDNESYDFTESYESASRHADDNVPMILDYDDVEEVGQDVEEQDAIRDADADDLPLLPKTLDDLPPLFPGEAHNGMVITWKQFILSKATNWQPQVLSLAGVICRIDDAGLEVMLAKRDRELEQPEKQYDDFTGQRVYDKFDAPEIEDDAETRRRDEGYRTLSFTNMMEPRILQPAISLEEAGEPTIPSIEDKSAELSHSAEVDGAPESQVEDATGIDCTSELKDTTFEGFDDTIPLQQDPPSLDAAATTETRAAILVPNGAEQDSMSLEQGTIQHSFPRDLGKAQSPAEISNSDLSQVSSPLRQLHDETSVLNGLSAGDEQSLGISHDISLTPLAVVESADMTIPDSLQDHETFSPVHETDVMTGTPRFTFPRPGAPPYSSSVCSGRQLDLSMDLGVNQPESFQAMTDDSEMHDTDGFDGGGEDPTITSNDETTLPGHGRVISTPGSPQRLESPASTCSLASLGTVWCTAATSRQTQSSLGSRMLSASYGSQVANDHDLEYEAAMRKLDEFSDGETSQVKMEDSFQSRSGANNDWDMGTDPDSNRLSLPAHARTDVAISPPTSRRRMARRRIPSSPPIKKRDSPQFAQRKSARVSSSSTFSLPPGTQVLEISSDSDEHKFTEHYADDDKDESYSTANDLMEDHQSPASLPRGSGWAKKTRALKSSLAVASHKTALKVNSRRKESSYSSQLKNMESAAAAMKRLKERTRAPGCRATAAHRDEHF